MNKFKVIYRILKYLEASLDYEEFDVETISPFRLDVTRERWEQILIMMQDNGYIKGIVVTKKLGDMKRADLSGDYDCWTGVSGRKQVYAQGGQYVEGCSRYCKIKISEKTKKPPLCGVARKRILQRQDIRPKGRGKIRGLFCMKQTTKRGSYGISPKNKKVD